MLITGSTRGIDVAIARLFAWEGARVEVHSRNTGALPTVQAEIEGKDGKAMQVAADLTNFAEIEIMMRRQLEGDSHPNLQLNR